MASLAANSSADVVIMAGSAALSDEKETFRMTVPDGDSEASGGTSKATKEPHGASLSSISAVAPRPGTTVTGSRDEVIALLVPVLAPTVVGRITAGDGWARDARMVEGIFQIKESMEPPWVTLNVHEVAAARYPDVDPETLRLTIMTVMMSQRCCVTRLTRAGLRLGPRTDLEGNAFVELDLDFADRYSISH